jgi:FAD synthetase
MDVACVSEELRPFVVSALHIVEEAFSRYTDDQVFLAFNGGKDCSVVLYLLHHFTPRRIPVVYFNSGQDFEQVLEHIRLVAQVERVTIRFVEQDVRAGTQLLVNEGFQACFLGQRQDDPSAPHSAFLPSTPGWPPLTRIFPILDWQISQVWSFHHELGLPICDLYRHGYTSIGPKSLTKPNPMLGDRPAWELFDSTFERAGRHS